MSQAWIRFCIDIPSYPDIVAEQIMTMWRQLLESKKCFLFQTLHYTPMLVKICYVQEWNNNLHSMTLHLNDGTYTSIVLPCREPLADQWVLGWSLEYCVHAVVALVLKNMVEMFHKSKWRISKLSWRSGMCGLCKDATRYCSNYHVLICTIFEWW